MTVEEQNFRLTAENRALEDRVTELERQLKDERAVSAVAQRNLVEFSTANARREMGS